LEDDIVRRFGGERIKGVMEWAGMGETTPIEHSWVNKAIENSQVRVEGYHFDLRKHLVEYDDVVNKHREVIYAERKKIISGANLKANIHDMIQQEIEALVDAHLGDGDDIDGLVEDMARIFPLPPSLNHSLSELNLPEIKQKLIGTALDLYEEKERQLTAENMRLLERLVMLRTIDNLWIEHLTMMEYIRQGIGLQAVGHTDPLVAYKKEGHALFQSLLANIQHDIVHSIYHVTLVSKEATPQRQIPSADKRGKKVGRNDPCPCGSGKKYKKCCGRVREFKGV
jgi:preprotein translocase subunit SecA